MTRALHWFRNDLRLRDNTALGAAARSADEIVALYVFDDAILGSPSMGAPRVRFLLDCLERLAGELEARGVPLLVRRGDPVREVIRALETSGAGLLSFNRDTTPHARPRDAAVRAAAEKVGARVVETRDRVVFESAEVRTRQDRAFAVYSPYRRAWFQRLEEDPQPAAPAPRLAPPDGGLASDPLPTAKDLGFGGDQTRLPTGGEEAAQRRLRSFLENGVERYSQERDSPAVDGTSRLSPYLRFGAISARDCIAKAFEASAAEPALARGVQKWVDELVWREFYAAILEENPNILRESHRPEYRDLVWNDDADGFEAWRTGRTGFPIVDAGMRQLAATGWMHNRVRMIVASFLTKDLLIDWREGQRWFDRQLVDADPASNNGGWQWSASTGTDAAPYFRIFNPVSQGERHDPEGVYVRRWVPELAKLEARHIHRPWEAPLLAGDYPAPIVNHAERRAEALARFEAVREAP